MLHRYFIHSTEDSTSTSTDDVTTIEDDLAQRLGLGEKTFFNMSCTEQDCQDDCGHSSASDNMDPDEFAQAVRRFEEAERRFEPSRAKDPVPGWERIISPSELDRLRERALTRLESIKKDCPDLHFYLSSIIRIVRPGDKLFFLLLHCPVQLSRGGMSGSCGCKHALGPNVDIASLGNCSLDALNGLSKAFFEKYSSLKMGSYGGGLGGINSVQGPCPTPTKAFAPCPDVDDNCPLPDKVVEGMGILFDFCEDVKADALMFSAAGTSLKANKRIIDPLARRFDGSKHISIIVQVLMNHLQFFRRGMEGKTLLESSRQMTTRLEQMSKLVGSFLEGRGVVFQEGETLIDTSCASLALPMIQPLDQDDSVTDEFLQSAITLSKTARRKEILRWCVRNQMSNVSGSSAALGYALSNLEDILSRMKGLLENGEITFAPSGIGEVLGIHVLSMMGKNSATKWLGGMTKQELTEWSKAMQKAKSRKRKREEEDVSGDVRTKEKWRKKKRKRGKCTHPTCTNDVVQGEVCFKHGAKVKATKKCTHPTCTNDAVQGGVCIRHGAKRKATKKCTHPTCTRNAVQGGVCFRHGAKKRKRAKCTHPTCTRNAVQGGVCVRHGAKVTRKKCTHPTCTRNAVQGGVCIKHGAKVTRKKCTHPIPGRK